MKKRTVLSIILAMTVVIAAVASGGQNQGTTGSGTTSTGETSQGPGTLQRSGR